MNKAIECLTMWFDGKTTREIKRPTPTYILRNLEYGIHTLYRYKEYTTICKEEVQYWEYFGFKVIPDGVGWKVQLGVY